MSKLVGLINFFFGIIVLRISVPYVLFTIPKLVDMYADAEVPYWLKGGELPYSSNTIYLFPTLLILLGLINVVVGLGNFNLIFKSKSDLIFKLGVFFALVSFIVVGMMFSGTISLPYPIHTLSNAISN